MDRHSCPRAVRPWPAGLLQGAPPFLLAASAALAMPGSGEAARSARPDRPPRNVVLVSLDSVRADHLPMYGYPRMTTPFLDRLFRGGRTALFERVTAVSPSCHPSHTAMLTGLYPQQVGVPYCGEDLVVKRADLADPGAVADLERYQADLRDTPEPLRRKKTSAIMNWLTIPETTKTLQGFLKGRGYRTGGFVSIWTLRGKFGYARGFDRFEDAMPEYYGPRSLAWLLRDTFGSQRRQRAGDTMAEAVDFIGEQDDESPFFVFINLADTHVPYRAPEGFTFRGETEEARRRLETARDEQYEESTREKAMRRMGAGTESFLPDVYDGSIAYTDSLLERLFGALESKHLLDRTLVIIAADHGDNLGEHPTLSREGSAKPFFEHSVYVWEQTQHVPLLAYDPSGRIGAGRHAVNVSTVDIVPTILGWLGATPAEFGAGVLPGTDLAIAGDEARRVFFLTWGRGRPGVLRSFSLDFPSYIGFRDGDLKFFVDRRRFRKAGEGRCFLFDLANDPWEKTNRCDLPESAAAVDLYRRELVTWYSSSVDAR